MERLIRKNRKLANVAKKRLTESRNYDSLKAIKGS